MSKEKGYMLYKTNYINLTLFKLRNFTFINNCVISFNLLNLHI